MNLSFSKFLVENSEKSFNSPIKMGTSLEYKGSFYLKPGESASFIIPKEYRHLMIRDMILAHRKGPHGHGEPNMKWEQHKSKWRDYYGAYTQIEAHDIQTGTWHTYVDDYGAKAKFAEHRSDFEEETLHDWIKIGKIKADIVKLTNPGNQRAGTNPITKEKVDPFDERSTSEIGSLKIIFFPDVDLTSAKYYERIYSASGGPTNAKTRFMNINSKDELEPSYGNFGAGIYPNALMLVSDWSRQSARLKNVDDKWYVVTDWNSFEKAKGTIEDRARKAVGGDIQYQYNGNNYIKLFPVTLDGGSGTRMIDKNTLEIEIPKKLVGKKLLQVEVMCGDTECRPDYLGRGKDLRRLGYALLTIGVVNKGTYRILTAGDGISVAPQMVASVGVESSNPVTLEVGDKILLTSKRDTTYVMGWRISYS